MDYQELYNTAIGLILFLIGWAMRILWDTLRELKETDRDLAEKVGRMEVLVAGEYVKKADFDTIMLRLFEKLDHIDAKLDRKQDK
jgi:hypothetical protein